MHVQIMCTIQYAAGFGLGYPPACASLIGPTETCRAGEVSAANHVAQVGLLASTQKLAKCLIRS